jgi:hypothetical protein
MIGPGQGGIRLTLLKNGVVSYLNAVLGAPRQQLCLRQVLSGKILPHLLGLLPDLKDFVWMG